MYEIQQNTTVVVNLYEIIRTQIALNQKYSKKVCERRDGHYSGDWRQASDKRQILSAADNEFYGELSDELKGHWCWFDPSKDHLNVQENYNKVIEEFADVICFITSHSVYDYEDENFIEDKEQGFLLIKDDEPFDFHRLRDAYGMARCGYASYKTFMILAMKMLGAEEVIEGYMRKVGKNGQRVEKGQTDGVDVKKELA